MPFSFVPFQKKHTVVICFIYLLVIMIICFVLPRFAVLSGREPENLGAMEGLKFRSL